MSPILLVLFAVGLALRADPPAATRDVQDFMDRLASFYLPGLVGSRRARSEYR